MYALSIYMVYTHVRWSIVLRNQATVRVVVESSPWTTTLPYPAVPPRAHRRDDPSVTRPCCLVILGVVPAEIAMGQSVSSFLPDRQLPGPEGSRSRSVQPRRAQRFWISTHMLWLLLQLPFSHLLAAFTFTLFFFFFCGCRNCSSSVTVWTGWKLNLSINTTHGPRAAHANSQSIGFQVGSDASP